MKKGCVLALIMLFAFVSSIVQAGTADVSTIVKKSEEALEAGRMGTRKVVITVKEGGEVASKWIARNAYKEFKDGKHALLVILEPESLKGNAYLFWKPKDKPLMEWTYFPPTRRVREMTVLMAYDSFLGTDFTWADFGIKEPEGIHKLLGEEVHGGRKAYKIETIPKEQWYYSRIVSWIAADTFLPIQRDYYNTSGVHWKTKSFENIVVLRNIPMPLQIHMMDIVNKRSTEITISDVCFDVEYISKDTFDPEKLSDAAFSPVCSVPVPDKK